MTEATKPCCSVWPEIIGRLDWMQFADEPSLATMPHLVSGDTRWHVNFCPICGKSVRDVIETMDAIKKAREHGPQLNSGH